MDQGQCQKYRSRKALTVNSRENMSNPLQVPGDYNAQGPREYQHALGRQRTNAKGHQSQTEDEKEDLSSS